MERGKRIQSKGLGDVLGKTKADVAAPEDGGVPEPERGSQELRNVEPRTTPYHPPAVRLGMTTGTPFPHVAGHVLTAKWTFALRIGADGGCLLNARFLAITFA